MISLNFKKETFIKNLLNLGHIVKIAQYDNLISSIKSIIQKEFIDSFSNGNLLEKIDLVFKSNPINLSVLVKTSDINWISKEYLNSLIDSGILDLHLEDIYIESFDKSIQLAAYKIQINERRGRNIFTFDKASSLYKEAKKCLILNKINLNEEDIKIINLNYIEKLYDYQIQHLSYRVDIDLDILLLQFQRNNRSVAFIYNILKEINFLEKTVHVAFSKSNIEQSKNLGLVNFIMFLDPFIGRDRTLKFITQTRNGEQSSLYNKIKDGLKNDNETFEKLLLEIKEFAPDNLEEYGITISINGKDTFYSYAEIIK